MENLNDIDRELYELSITVFELDNISQKNIKIIDDKIMQLRIKLAKIYKLQIV